MATLYNQYISQSYQGLLHFDNNNSASATLTQIQNGLGQNLGLYLNNNGDLQTTTSISSSLIETTKLIVKNKLELTGSVDILGSVTASNAYITNDLIVSGTIYAYKINTTIESSSVIFSSGSNILGDSTADTQTLNGTIIMSGSSQLTGSMGISANLNVLGNISSSTLSGVGNVTTYSASVNTRLVYLEGPFSQSVSAQIISLQQFTGSQGLTTSASFNAYTASTNNRLNNLELTTASLNNSVSALNIFSASAKIELSNLELTSASVNISIAALNGATASLQSKTGSYATTGSNTFIGNEVFSGSVRGQVFPITITSNTASMNCSLGNFFTVSLPGGTTRLEATNIQPGETLSLKIFNQTTGSIVNTSVSVKFPTGFTYSPTAVTSSTDIITFLSFDTGSIYAVAGNYFA